MLAYPDSVSIRHTSISLTNFKGIPLLYKTSLLTESWPLLESVSSQCSHSEHTTLYFK